MGMSTGGKKGGGISEINITPLVDVVLVLLIIFIVIAPLLTSQIPIQIPEQQKEDIPVETQPDNKQIVLKVSMNGAEVALAINGAPVSRKELGGQLKKYFTNRAKKLLFFDASDDVPYGEVVKIMEIVHSQGITLGVTPEKIEG